MAIRHRSPLATSSILLRKASTTIWRSIGRTASSCRQEIRRAPRYAQSHLSHSQDRQFTTNLPSPRQTIRTGTSTPQQGSFATSLLRFLRRAIRHQLTGSPWRTTAGPRSPQCCPSLRMAPWAWYVGLLFKSVQHLGRSLGFRISLLVADVQAREEFNADTASSQFFWFLFEPDLTPAGRNLLDGRYTGRSRCVTGHIAKNKARYRDAYQVSDLDISCLRLWYCYSIWLRN